ncbi:competence/damage-inducible protein A [Oceanirhabdus seepicola]|uniref:Putative competence-damage inducible protein n=1 Tax=Oceanirhabdus seepicola TaxID=2828781 RepID=A0A9J6PAU3_9CLOT|nr:competence/damage-inducible protein A [Oceanirhabdus seepicola]MCM1992288.1 competence/damage-inducible protein A [Oceanirhabdus seepicola]
MKAEILCIGTELLLGNIVNTNAQYLSEQLAAAGVSVYYHTVVGDNPERVKKALEIAYSRADMVITTGGLGPTQDDLSKKTIGEFFNREMVFNQECMNEIEKYFKRINRTMTKNNESQAYFPEGAIILKNSNGTAPGMILEDEGKVCIVLPGPPVEMTLMYENEVVPYLQEKTDEIILSKTLKVMGIGESKVEEMISDIINKQTNPTIAPYAKGAEVHLRITCKTSNKEEALEKIEKMEQEVRAILGDNIYGCDDDTLEGVICKLLEEKGLKIAVAESCTGGMISAKLVNHPGASAVFMEGAVTYSNEAKMNRLNVRKESLDKYGAVSSQVAEEMAKGIAETAKCDIGLSTTGVAGPGGGTPEKPVGLVYLGFYYRGNVFSQEIRLNGDRLKVRDRTTKMILDRLRRALLKDK